MLIGNHAVTSYKRVISDADEAGFVTAWPTGRKVDNGDLTICRRQRRNDPQVLWRI
jgi:hypothetical protein